jgi:hypothetical protein
MSIFINNPGLAFVPVILFVAAYIHHRVLGGRGFRPARLVVLAGGCIWLLYALYELSVQGKLKPESVPIRVDMLFIGPALLITSALAVFAYLFGFPHKPSSSQAEMAGRSPSQPTKGTALADMDTANQKLAHLLPAANNDQKTT